MAKNKGATKKAGHVRVVLGGWRKFALFCPPPAKAKCGCMAKNKGVTKKADHVGAVLEGWRKFALFCPSPPDANVSRHKTPKASGKGLSYKGLIAFYTSVDSSTCGRQQCIKAFCCRSGLTPPSLGLDSKRRSSVNSSARRRNRLDCWLRFLRRFRV